MDESRGAVKGDKNNAGLVFVVHVAQGWYVFAYVLEPEWLSVFCFPHY